MLRGVVEGGRADGAPGVERGDRAVGAERERDAGPQQRGERVERAGALRAEALGVQAVLAAPQGVEGGLDGGGEAELGERGDRPGVTISACSTRCRAARTRARPSFSAAARTPSTTVLRAASPIAWKPAWRPASVQATTWAATASASRCAVPVWAASAYGWCRQAVCEPRAPSANRSPGRAERAQLAGLGDVLLGPVADHARARFLAGESQQAGEVVLGGDLGAAALVHRADAEGRRVREGGALGGGALRGGVTAPRAVARTAWWSSPVSGRSSRVTPPATRSSRAVETTAECTSMRLR